MEQSVDRNKIKTDIIAYESSKTNAKTNNLQIE